MDLFFADVNFSHVISFAVNYRLFSHGVVSYMFNEESDNGVLEYRFTHDVKAGLGLHWAHIGFCCLIDACSILMNPASACKLGYIVQFLKYGRRLLGLYNTIFDGPGRKPPKPTGFLEAWQRL